MLARLLRRAILSQMVLGAALGCLLSWFANAPVWTALLLALLLPVLTNKLIILYSTIKSKAASEPLGAWLKSMIGEMQSSFWIFLMRQPWTSGAPGVLASTAGKPRVPVVLVHGYVCNHRVWDTMARTLRAQGHSVIAVDLEPLFTSIDKYAPAIESAVTALCRRTGATQVALMGHSMGGLAIRAWMRKHGSARVARVLTLGTPHVGTQIAPKTRTPNGQQMAWQSLWLAELAASESIEVRGLMRIALTPQDNIVYPQRVQFLPDVPATVFEGIGHLQMCRSAAVMQWVHQQLAGLEAPTERAAAIT